MCKSHFFFLHRIRGDEITHLASIVGSKRAILKELFDDLPEDATAADIVRAKLRLQPLPKITLKDKNETIPEVYLPSYHGGEEYMKKKRTRKDDFFLQTFISLLVSTYIGYCHNYYIPMSLSFYFHFCLSQPWEVLAGVHTGTKPVLS